MSYICSAHSYLLFLQKRVNINAAISKYDKHLMQVIVMLAENKDRAVFRYLDKFGRNRRESLPLIQLSNQK